MGHLGDIDGRPCLFYAGVVVFALASFLAEMTTVRNLFSDIPFLESGERFEEWLRCKNLVIERIVSSAKPEPTAYDQAQDEWVALLQGTASLEIEDQVVTLTAGDTLFIPARTPHRVLATSETPRCVWLALRVD